MTALKNIDVLEEIFDQQSSRIDLGNLAKLLEVSNVELADAFNLDPSSIGRKKLSPDDKIIKSWMVIFNRIVDLIKQTEPELSKENVRLKMSRWIKMPNSHLGDMSPFEAMIKGKSKRVINLLEQLSE